MEAMREMTREELIKAMNDFRDLYVKANNELEQERVQHAGCLVAAEGATNPDQTAKKGMYGWSLAYQTVLDLRTKYEKLLKAREDAMNNLGVPSDDYPAPVAEAYRILKEAVS